MNFSRADPSKSTIYSWNADVLSLVYYIRTPKAPYRFMKRFLLIVFAFTYAAIAHAQMGLRGTVKSAAGEVLPYAAVFI